MTVNEKLIAALSPLGLQLFPDMRQALPDECMVFTYSELPADSGDDYPEHERILLSVHLFCPIDRDSVEIRRKIKACIAGAGYTYPSVADLSEETGQHWVFEFEDAEAAVDGEL